VRLVIYGINYSPELTGIGKYSSEMAEWFSKQGHEVRVVTAPPYYPEWKIRDGYSSWRYKKETINKVQIIRAPIYVPKNPKLITRLLHLISFSISSFPVIIKQFFWKPDVIFYVQPTLFASLGAILLAKMSGGKAIMHIQDYEIDAMFGLGMMNNGLISILAKASEKWLMSHFDLVSTISYSMIDKAKSKCVSEGEILLFPNWADTEFVAPDIDGSALKHEWGFSDNDQVLLYAGNIGKKQGLELVLDAAEKLKDKLSVQFVIVGTGAHIEALKSIVVEKQLVNVHFKPLQPWERVPEMLAMADVHLVVQKRGAADVVLPSKLTNILSIGGHALVTAEKNTELGLLADRFPGIYKCIDPEDSILFSDSLFEMLEDDLSEVNQVARDYAVRYLSKNNVLSGFEHHLKELVGIKDIKS